MSLIKSVSGIRGTIGGTAGHNLTPQDAVLYTAAFATWLKYTHNTPTVIVGRDARTTGEQLTMIVCNTLIMCGINVIQAGLTTTPTLALGVECSHAQGGIMLTASHNPAQWNALKLFNQKGEFLTAEEGKVVLNIAHKNDIIYAEWNMQGVNKQGIDFLQYHINQICALPLVDIEAIKNANFKIVVDGINSSGGIAVPAILKALGIRHIKEMNCEPTGHFAHNPEPLPQNLTSVCNEVTSAEYDLAIVVDPDVDRLCFICEDGSMFGEEYTLVAVAKYVLQHTSGNTVSNLSSSRALKDITISAGGQYYASAVGEAHVVQKMKEVNAVIGGEGNGGVIYPPLHYGRDALVGIALFLSALAKFGKPASFYRATLPQYHISKNKIELTPDIDIDIVLAGIKSQYAGHDTDITDGVKINFDAEWVHLRPSNTEPIIRIYAESATNATADYLAEKIIKDIKELIN
ncbi:MAG: phosphoglucosamine mutase [Cytophagales bacterium]|nr:phosphoglucosamine mutase [Cytophagales bacterium]